MTVNAQTMIHRTPEGTFASLFSHLYNGVANVGFNANVFVPDPQAQVGYWETPLPAYDYPLAYGVFRNNGFSSTLDATSQPVQFVSQPRWNNAVSRTQVFSFGQ